jgi:hypothetical protein
MYANFRMRRAHSTDIAAVLAASNNVFVMYANFRIDKSSLQTHSSSSCNTNDLRKAYSTCVAILLAPAMTGHQLPPLNEATTPVSGMHV